MRKCTPLSTSISRTMPAPLSARRRSWLRSRLWEPPDGVLDPANLQIGRTSMPRRNSFLPWKAVVCALSIAASCGVAAAQGAPPPPSVSVTPVVSRQITETNDYIGRVAAIDKVDLVARVPGFIEQRNFTEGQLVKKGDLLFRIEQATYRAALAQARATLAKAKATAVNTKLQLERGQELLRNNNIPQATVD